MEQPRASQSMLDDYFGPLELKFSFTPWEVPELTQIPIDSFFKSKNVSSRSSSQHHKPNSSVLASAMAEETRDQLMSDDDELLASDDEIFGIAGIAQPEPEPSILKRKRVSDESDSDSDSMDIQDVSAPTTRLKRLVKKQKTASDDDGVDAYLKTLEEAETSGIPPTTETNVELVASLFADEEESDDPPLTSEKSKHQDRATALQALTNKQKLKRVLLAATSDDDEVLAIEEVDVDDDDASTKKSTSESTLPSTITTPEGIPLFEECGDVGVVRCTYAAHPITLGWSPFSVEFTEDLPRVDKNKTPISEEGVISAMWGVFVYHGETMGAGDGKSQRRKTLEFDISEDPHPDYKFGSVPWFILMGNERLMKLIASPFFYYRIRANRVDPRYVKFQWRTHVPIFYVFGVDEKTPMWSNEHPWAPPQLLNLLKDTLYSHVEYESKGKIASSMEDANLLGIVRRVLSDIGGFPAALNNPAANLLPPNDVPLNNYSTRKERSTYLSDKLLSIFKPKASKGAHQNLDASTLIKLVRCMGSLTTPGDYLFADLEKPCTSWDRYGVKQFLPVAVLSSISNWQTDAYEDVLARFDTLKGISVLSDASRRSEPFPMHVLFAVRPILRFNVSWFADWFNEVRDFSNRQERLAIYAFFMASSLWEDIQEETRRYGSLSTYAFTSARREWLLESDYLWLSDDKRLALKLDGKPRPPVKEPLASDERAQLLTQCLEHLETINEYAKKPFHIYQQRAHSIQSTALVGSLRHSVSVRLSKMVLGTCLLFHSVVGNKAISPPILAQLSPIVVQSSVIYGAMSGTNTEAMHEQIQQMLGKEHAGCVLVIKHTKHPSELRSVIKIVDGVQVKSPKVIVFDLFHRWSLELIENVMTKLKDTHSLDKCTHMIFTGFSNSCGNLSGGGSLIWELMEIAEYMEGVLKFTAPGEPLQNLPFATSFFKMLEEHKRQRSAHRLFKLDDDKPGDQYTASDNLKSNQDDSIAMQAYSEDDRRLQLEQNKKLLMTRSEYKSYQDVCRILVKSIEQRGLANAATTKGGSIGIKTTLNFAIVYVRAMTKSRIFNHLKSAHYATYEPNKTLFRFMSYHDIESDPTRLEGVTHIILNDLDYAGYGCINYMHINTAIEYARKGVFCLFSPSNDVQNQRAVTFEDIETQFLRNDFKSQRYLTSIGRCPLLRETFFGYFSKPQLRQLFGMD